MKHNTYTDYSRISTLDPAKILQRYSFSEYNDFFFPFTELENKVKDNYDGKTICPRFPVFPLKQKDNVKYCHHFVSIIVCKLLTY